MDELQVRADPLFLAEVQQRAGMLVVELAAAGAAMRAARDEHTDTVQALRAHNLDLTAEVETLRAQRDATLGDPHAVWQHERTALHDRIAELEQRLNTALAEEAHERPGG